LSLSVIILVINFGIRWHSLSKKRIRFYKLKQYWE